MVYLMVCSLEACFDVYLSSEGVKVSKEIKLDKVRDKLTGEPMARLGRVYLAVKKNSKIRKLFEELLVELENIAEA